MRWRRKRIRPSVTELVRVEKVLEADLALRRYLGQKTSPIRKRSGEMVQFSAEAIAVTEALKARKLNPERAAVGKVLNVAVDVLGINCAPK